MNAEALIFAAAILALVLAVRRPFRKRQKQSRFYRWYMKSSLWKARRAVWYWFSDRRCEKCRRKMVLHPKGMRYRLGAETVTVHHKHYRSLGHERRRDVELLCWPCHSAKDAYRFRR